MSDQPSLEQRARDFLSAQPEGSRHAELDVERLAAFAAQERAAERAFVVELLDKRMRRILEIGRENSDPVDENADIGQSQCFHLMEIQRILQGKTTSGVYDDYGRAAAIRSRKEGE